MTTHARLTALAITALLTAAPRAQEPAPDAPVDLRITYELPTDALQRTLRDDPSRTLEQLLAETVRVLEARLGSLAEVERHEATGFRVTVREATPERMAEVDRRIATQGRLELCIVASPRYEGGELALDEERAHLEQWLDDGGRERVLADPAALADLPRREGSNVRWVRRVIGTRAGQRWGRSFRDLQQMQQATVALYDDATWNDGDVPADMQGDDDLQLVELVALNVHAETFSQRDLDPDGVKVSAGMGGGFAVAYQIRGDRRQAYADWSERFVGFACAIVVDGELLSAPIFISRIPGRGIISGDFDEAGAEALAAALRSGALPTAPKRVSVAPLKR